MASIDYIAEADRVKNAFLDYIVNCSPEDWKLVKESSEGVKVYSRRSEELKGNMYKSEVTLDAPPDRVFAMLSPIKPYRPKWDTFLNQLETAKEIDSRRFLIYHVTNPAMKGLISARDSIDVVTIGETESYYFVAAGGIELPEYPPSSKYVRTFQYPAGYIVYKMPEEADKSKWVMLFHVDLNLNNLASFVLDKVKPNLMIQKVNSLRQGLKTIMVEDKDLLLS